MTAEHLQQRQALRNAVCTQQRIAALGKLVRPTCGGPGVPKTASRIATVKVIADRTEGLAAVAEFLGE